MTERIDWNDALGDLQLLGDLERNSIEAYMENDIETYYKTLRAYFQKLCSMVEFDKLPFQKSFDYLKNIIFAAEQDEETLSKLGRTMESLEYIYYRLTEIKVQAGLSVNPKELKKIVLQRKSRETQKKYPILELK